MVGRVESGSKVASSLVSSEKSLRGFLWVRVLVVAAGTSEGFEWVVEQWWETIMVIAPSRRTLIFCYA